jgi:CBS domain-containing protein
MDDGNTVTAEIHQLCVFGPSGKERRSLAVYCATHGATVPLAHCERCVRLTGTNHKRQAIECAPTRERATTEPGRTGAEAVPVAAIMSRRAVCVTPDLRVDDIEAIVLDAGAPGAIVVDPLRKPIGVVSKTDLLRARHEHEVVEDDGARPAVQRGGVRARLEDGFHTEPHAITRALDIMTPIAFTLTENASVARGAALMALESIHEVPIVDGAGRMVGLLTALDVMRWMAAYEGYLVG